MIRLTLPNVPVCVLNQIIEILSPSRLGQESLVAHVPLSASSRPIDRLPAGQLSPWPSCFTNSVESDQKSTKRDRSLTQQTRDGRVVTANEEARHQRLCVKLDGVFNPKLLSSAVAKQHRVLLAWDGKVMRGDIFDKCCQLGETQEAVINDMLQSCFEEYCCSEAKSLIKFEEDIMKNIFEKIEGPFVCIVYFPPPIAQVWAMRDKLGRRSLCLTYSYGRLTISSGRAIGHAQTRNHFVSMVQQDKANHNSTEPSSTDLPSPALSTSSDIVRELPVSGPLVLSLLLGPCDCSNSSGSVKMHLGRTLFFKQSISCNRESHNLQTSEISSFDDPNKKNFEVDIAGNQSIEKRYFSARIVAWHCPTFFRTDKFWEIISSPIAFKIDDILGKLCELLLASVSSSIYEYYPMQAISDNFGSGVTPDFNSPTPLNTTFPSEQSSHQLTASLMFSGGVDSGLLAALVLKAMPPSWTLELVNVVFGTPLDAPDRFTALATYKELKEHYPQFKIRLICINVSKDKLASEELCIFSCIKPRCTHMDFNIGSALYFAARGRGYEIRSDLFDVNGLWWEAFYEHHVADKACCPKPRLKCPAPDPQPCRHCHLVRREGCSRNACRLCCVKLHQLGKEKEEALPQGNVASDQRSDNDCPAHGRREKRLQNADQLAMREKCLYEPSGNVLLENGNTPGSIAVTEAVENDYSHVPSKATAKPSMCDCCVHRQVVRTVEIKSSVILSGHGADELFGGYGRHNTVVLHKGLEGLKNEMKRDLERLWERNLGRDDRCIAAWGRAARVPFLAEAVVRFIGNLPFECLFSEDEDKPLLRMLARKLCLARCATFKKRAIQFGTRATRQTNLEHFSSHRKADGSAIYRLSTG